MNGIYCYQDLESGKIVYVGKDSHIDENRRFLQHKQPSNYGKQPFNSVLQNNLDRYSYKVLKQGDFPKKLLNALEIIYIRRYNPKFNYTIGGEGTSGYKLSEETCNKIKENRRNYRGKNNPFYGKRHSDESKKKISKAKSGKNNFFYGKSLSNSHRKNISIAQNNTGYFRVHKVKCPECSQGFRWKYTHYENGKQKSISSVDFYKLEEKVKSKGLEWFKFEDKDYMEEI